MPVRNLWSLEPDECIVAEELVWRIKDCQIYFPLHDVGVDLLVVKGDRHVGLQVKGSRYYTAKRRGVLPKERWHSWHQIKAKKLAHGDNLDFYIFVTYMPKQGEHKVSSFETKFLILPTKEILRRIAVKNKGKRDVYSFYFRFEDKKIIDIRERNVKEELMDYSQFLDRWDLVEDALKDTRAHKHA